MSKIIIEWLSKHCVHLFIAKKYKNEDGSFTEEGVPIGNKMRQNIYKALWSIVFTVFGHMVLHQIKYFPWELFGSGDMNKLLEEGYPAYYFHDRPYLFDTLYILNLAYYLMDFIYLVFINDHQSDFFLMVLHHLATIFLIFFSYMVNLSNIGCIVFHLHNLSNIFIYFVRISMFSDVGTIVKAFFTTLLILNFTFTRIYVFGKLIVYCYFFLVEWHWIVFYLWSLKVLLLVMHVYWVYEIFRKFYLYLTENKVEDIARYKTQ